MSDPITPEPVSPDSSVTQPVSALQPNIAAMLAFIPLLGGIIFLVLEKKNQFVRFNAAQSTVFNAGAFVVFVALGILSAIFFHVPLIGWLFAVLLWPLYWVLLLGFWAVTIIGAVNAYKQKEWLIPYVGLLARKQLSSGVLSKI